MISDSDSESDEENEINECYIRENRTETHIFSYSKPSDLLDKLLIEIQMKGDNVLLKNWEIEYPQEFPRVRITFMKVKRKYSKMICIKFSRITGSYQDFLQEFKKCKDCISHDIDADTEDSEEYFNPLDSNVPICEDQEMKSSDVEKAKQFQDFKATQSIAFAITNTSFS
jgi:hypothetical protein